LIKKNKGENILILSSQTIRQYCKPIKMFNAKPMLSPFREAGTHSGMSFGLSCSGYDIRIDQDVILYPTTLANLILNSIGFKRSAFSLASSVEEFCMPSNIMGFVTDKSTWARRGLAVQNTCIEPGWGGKSLTLELSNHSDNVIRIKRGAPIAQVVFYKLDFPTDLPYVGKYSNQPRGPQKAILV
jgi:dCTP deaminase